MPIDVLKICTGCKAGKDRSAFTPRKANKDGLSHRCRGCVNRRQRILRAKNPGKHRAKIRAYRKKNPDKQKKYDRRQLLKRKYGLSEEQYLELYNGQNGRCGICCSKFDESIKANVDHDHSSKYVRGVLCHPCNSLIGFAKDDVVVLALAAKYLRNAASKEIGVEPKFVPKIEAQKVI